MSKEAQSGWTPTKHKSRRKSRGRNNLMNALAHAKDKHADGVEHATNWLLAERRWWDSLAEEARRPYLDGSIRRFGPPLPPPHPDSVDGKAFIERHFWVRPWAKKIAKLERELSKL